MKSYYVFQREYKGVSNRVTSCEWEVYELTEDAPPRNNDQEEDDDTPAGQLVCVCQEVHYAERIAGLLRRYQMR